MSDKSGPVGGVGQPPFAEQHQVGREALVDSFRMVQLIRLDDMGEFHQKAVAVAPLNDPTMKKRATAR